MSRTRFHVLVAGLFASLVQPTMGQLAWSTYQGNPSHDGYVPIGLDPSQFALRWQKTIPGGRQLNPVSAADGKVFVSQSNSNGDALFALNSETGNTLWTKNFGAPFSVNPPSFGYGNVYIQTGNHGSDTYLRAYNAVTGDLVFRTPHSAQWESYYAPTVFQNRVYVNGGYYGGMYSFDAHTGGQNWFQGLQQYDDWTPAVNNQYAIAYVGEYSPGLYVFDRLSGTPAFSIPDPNFNWNGWSMNLAPVLGSRNNVIAIHSGRLIDFQLDTQSIGYEIPGAFTGQPTVANGNIFTNLGGALSVRRESDGSPLWAWEAPAGGILTGTMIATNTHLFVRTSSKVYALNLYSHQVDWSYNASGNLTLGPDALYIAGANGQLTAINMPEPGTLCLLTLGIACTRARRRRVRV